VAVARPLYLLDKSALVRLKHEQVDQVVTPLMKRGQIATCGVTDLEVLYSARSPAEYETVWAHRLAAYRHLPITERVVERAIEVQRALAATSQHRAVGIADLLVAACAELGTAIMLHYDKDFDTVATVTGQPTLWVVPRGTVP
jgi:predicted nucleic acid-binding protein